MSQRLVREQACERCGKACRPYPRQRYCSRACHYATAQGVERVRGTRYVRADGYVVVKTGVRVWTLEHRLVAAQMLGRSLTAADHVHHRNGDKQDNRPENLLIVGNAAHQRLHQSAITRSGRAVLTCAGCGASYERKASRVAGSHYCSAACRLKAQHEAARAYWARRRQEAK